MGITHAFVSARSDGSDPTQVQPSHWNAEHVGTFGGSWGTELAKSGDQVSVTTVLADATDLAFAVTTLSVWRFEAELVYSGTSATGDFKWAFNVTAGVITGWHRYVGSDTAADAINVSTGIRVNGLTTTAQVAAGTDASNSLRSLLIEGTYRFSADATFKLQFAQNSASGTTTLKAGSTLRARRLI